MLSYEKGICMFIGKGHLTYDQGRRNIFEHGEDRFFARAFLFGRSE